MIARLLISSSIKQRREEINKILALHFRGLPAVALAKAGGKLNNPDILYFKTGEKLGIAEARKITGYFSFKPYSGKVRAVIIEDTRELTEEAQNALLKTIEELPKEAILILGADTDAYLLPTILSRVRITHLEMENSTLSKASFEDIEKLLSANPEERFEYIEKLGIREEFLHILILFFRQMLYALEPRLGKLEVTKFLKELLQAEQMLKHNVNIRPLLEYLMLVMPKKEW